MTSLYSLSEKLEVGDKIAWVGETHIENVDQITPRTVTGVNDETDGEIRVDAKGINGGQYYYIVDRAGNSESFYVKSGEPESEKSIPFAEMTLSDERVSVRRGYHDSR